MFLKYTLMCVYTLRLARSCTNNTNSANPLSMHLADYDWSQLCFSQGSCRYQKHTHEAAATGVFSEDYVETQCECDSGRTALEVWAQGLASPSMWPWASPPDLLVVVYSSIIRRIFQWPLSSHQVFVKIKLDSRHQSDLKCKSAIQMTIIWGCIPLTVQLGWKGN